MKRVCLCTVARLGLAALLVSTFGCGGSGGGGGAPTGGSPILLNRPVRWLDLNDNFILDAGDRIIVTFDRSVAPGANAANPALDLNLGGPNFPGAGAAWTDGPDANQLTLNVGPGATLFSGLQGAVTTFDIAGGNAIRNPVDGTVGATPLGTSQSIVSSFADSGQAIGVGNSTAIAALSANSGTDALVDLIVGKGPGAAEIYLATAAGLFGTPVNPIGDPGTHSTADIAVGDLDLDGDFDFITGNGGGQPNFVYLNDGLGAGTFRHVPAPGQNELGTGNTTALGLDFFDLAGGRLDVVVANGGTGVASINMIYFDGGPGLFDGTGAFAGTNPLAFGGVANTTAMILVDVDGGGQTDIVTVDSTVAGGTITAHLVTPANPPTLTPVVTTGLLFNPTAVTAQFINADGNMDLVVGYDGGGGVQVWLGDGAGGFNLGQTIPGGSVGALGLTLTNQDGPVDFVVGNRNNQPDRILLNAGLPGGGLQNYLVDAGVALGSGSTLDLDVGLIDAGVSWDFASASVTPNKLWRNGK